MKKVYLVFLLLLAGCTNIHVNRETIESSGKQLENSWKTARLETTVLENTIEVISETTFQKESIIESTVLKPIVKEEVKDKVIKTKSPKKMKANSMSYKGKTWNLSHNFGSPNTHNGLLPRIQKYIDNGGVAVFGSDLVINDRKYSIIAAHNPGSFSFLAKTLRSGDTIRISDKNGSEKDYRMSFLSKTYLNRDTTVTNKKVENILEDIYALGDAIIIQYCVGDIIYLWQGK